MKIQYSVVLNPNPAQGSFKTLIKKGQRPFTLKTKHRI